VGRGDEHLHDVVAEQVAVVVLQRVGRHADVEVLRALGAAVGRAHPQPVEVAGHGTS
jgi:hypothetical protein